MCRPVPPAGGDDPNVNSELAGWTGGNASAATSCFYFKMWTVMEKITLLKSLNVCTIDSLNEFSVSHLEQPESLQK